MGAVSSLVTGAYGTMCKCFFRYKNKITAESESCFHLHKILDSVVVGIYGFCQTLLSLCREVMTTIKFLHETLNFSDGLIKKLCMFKDVIIKGELYSSEFQQFFKTDSSVCSFKENTDGKFDFKIDGFSHII